jgi:hypothetical protein
MKQVIRRAPEEALRASVDALGGLQEVGHALKGADSDPVLAGQWLSHCLTESKRDKLSLSQIVHVFKRASAIGEHDGFAIFALLCGYQVQPIGVEAQLAEAMKAAEQARAQAEETARNLQTLLENPKLLATMRAAHLNVEAAA